MSKYAKASGEKKEYVRDTRSCNSKSNKNESNVFSSHRFKKSLGQNFIKDTNLLTAIVHDSGITKSDYVLEIGAGAGTLTEILCKFAKYVISVEIDESLKETLEQKESENENLKVIFGDIMKCELSQITSKFDQELTVSENINFQQTKYKVVANLPYYITTSILFKLLNEYEHISSITIMVQKEVAERIISDENRGDYGVLSLMVRYFGTAKIVRNVGRNNFYPVPKVDSCIIKIDIDSEIDRELLPKFRKLVKCAFLSRRKTLLNNLKREYSYPADDLEKILDVAGIGNNVRGEDLSFDQFRTLANKL